MSNPHMWELGLAYKEFLKRRRNLGNRLYAERIKELEKRRKCT